MKRFFVRLGRFFWSWGFLKFVLCVIALIILFYVEEDWRGARAWAATKAEWEAKGESFDYNKFIPPPVPDEQNLAAIPLFKMEPDPQDANKTYLYPITLEKALRTGLPGNDTPATGNWMGGKLPDMEQLRHLIAIDYATTFKGVTPPQDALDQFDALYPFLSDLRAASATRPLCRFAEDYSIYFPASRSLGLLTDQIKLSKVLTLHAILALDHQQPDLALEDIKINYKLLSGVQRDPSIIGGLVANGMAALNDAALYYGLAQHLWSDAQLVELEQTLEPVDFLSDYQFAMRSEVAEAALDIDYIKHAPRSASYGFVNGMSDTATTPILPFLWPNGWWDQNKCQMAAFIFNSLPSVDPKTQLVFPAQVNELEKQLQRLAKRKDAIAPWNVLFLLMTSYVPEQPPKFAYAQDWVDEARIACALERYRLAHGVYPGTLDALAPACIDELPHDIMNGQPHHYQLRPDGTYLLYSVGWNQTDDGGKVVYKKDSPTQIDYKEGDWVWPTPQATPAK